MIASSDLICLVYTPDLSEGGIAYAIRSLPYTYLRLGTSPFDQLRRIVANTSVELPFRRYLGERGIPFNVKAAPPFTGPEHYDVLLGGHRCNIQSFLISHPDQISRMQANTGLVLTAPALVASDRHAAEEHGEHDLYLFAFVEGLVTSCLEDLREAVAAGKPSYLLHCMPQTWARPQKWNPLGPLSLESESGGTLTVDLAGQDETRGFLTRRVEVPPHTRVIVDEPFFSLSSAHVDRPLECRLRIHSPRQDETHIINEHEWGNIWVYGKRILLAGYISPREFSDRAIMMPPGSHVFQFGATRAKNLAVPVSAHKPLGELLERLQAGHAEKPDGAGIF